MTSPIDRVSRLIDLFSEGTVVLLGYDDTEEGVLPTPVVVWMNKLNSFEVQEAREDGNVRRSERMHQLGKPDAPEKLGFDAEAGSMSHEDLAERYVEAQQDDIYLEVVNDIEMAPEWRERRDRMLRLPALLADAGVADDDPRRATLAEDQTAWIRAVAEGQVDKQKVAFDEAKAMEHDALVAAVWERYRQRQTLDVFVQERRTTQLWLGMRVCKAVDLSTETGKHKWDHSACNHAERMLAERADVRGLPDAVIEKCADAIDGITINPRMAGNSDAPVSSSAPSEPSSESVEGSAPSVQAETSSAPLGS